MLIPATPSDGSYDHEIPDPKAVTIPAAFTDLRRSNPQRVIFDDGEEHSIDSIGRRVEDLALQLVALGASPGDRIAIQGPNGVPWAVAALAILDIGATVLPVSTRYSSAETTALLLRSGAEIAFGSENFLGRDYVSELRAASPALTVIRLEEDGLRHDMVVDDAQISSAEDLLNQYRASVGPDTIAIVQYTSGTTGAPKGALLRHGALVATTREWIAATGLRAGDRYAVVAPFFHISGYKTGILACLLAGAIVHPVERFDPDSLLDLIETAGISVLQGPPTLFHGLMSRRSASDRQEISSLRLGVTGGTVVPPPVVAQMRQELELDSVVTSYGLTEATGVVTICRPGDSDEVVGTTSGRAIGSAEVLIRPLDPPEADGRGEILVRSDHLMAGYLDDPDSTAGAIDEQGYLHTGDVGYLDSDGNLVLTGRLSDMFIVGGFNAYPAEIEEVLLRHPMVASAAVVGVPDDRLGEVAAAFIVPQQADAFDREEVDAHAARHLAGFKRPRTIDLLEVLPLNVTGKVDKAELRRRWTENTA